MRGHLTEKADVFGFGVVALEILSGRPNTDNSLDAKKMYLLEWVYKNGVSFSSSFPKYHCQLNLFFLCGYLLFLGMDFT